jgi:hypothetical protein
MLLAAVPRTCVILLGLACILTLAGGGSSGAPMVTPPANTVPGCLPANRRHERNDISRNCAEPYGPLTFSVTLARDVRSLRNRIVPEGEEEKR